MADTDVQELVLSFPEWQATTFAVDCTGKRAVLAVQKWLAVVNLDQPEDFSEPKAIRKLGRQNKYEIKAVLWNPHFVKEDLLASTCQQKLEVWNMNAERHPLVHSIKAHTRPISDLTWSFSDPNLLASCAVDSYVHVWDIRDVKRPKSSFKAVAGASLVQWNRLNGNLLASAHDSDVRIWDMRKPTTASGYITAHMSRIHDLDWSYVHEKELTTCSHDASIKFWDTLSPREPLSVIKAGAQPLWRARNYPIGNAVAMVLVPAMHSGDSRVFLWSRNNIASPRHIFKGSSEPVLEVQWRRHGSAWDLVTWSKDRALRIWALSEDLRLDLGADHLTDDIGEDMIDPTFDLSGQVDMSLSSELDTAEPPVGPERSPMVTRSIREGPLSSSFTRGSPLRSVGSLPRNESPSSLTRTSSSGHPVFQPQTAHTLAQEFSLLNLDNVSNLEIETKDVAERRCVVKVELGGHVVRMQITFPSHYPNGAAPSFAFDKSTTIDNGTQGELVKIITDTANSCVKQNRPCLEQCLKKLTKTLESFVSRPPPPAKQPDFDIVFGHLDDEHIPFPRTSGARFCPSGLLVCFNSLPELTLADAPKLPRSLDKMNMYRSRVSRGGQIRWSGYSTALPKRGSSGANLAGLSNFVTREKVSASVQGDKGVNPGLVTVYDSMPLLPIDYGLAKAYSMNYTDLKELCTSNASVAAQAGRMDLVQAWSAAMLIADLNLKAPMQVGSQVPWPEHPFGRRLIHSLFNHFAKLHDIQMLAMLGCLFQEHCAQFDATTRKSLLSKKPDKGTTHIRVQNGNHHHMSVNKSLHPKAMRVSPPQRVHAQVHVAPDRWSLSGGSMGGSERPSPISSSWHEVDLEMDKEEHLGEEEDTHVLKCRLLDDLLTQQCDEYCRAYANVLYAWQLLDQRAEILKHQSSAAQQRSAQIGFAVQCRRCMEVIKNSPSCRKSRCFAFTCSICNLAVKGSSNFCLSCGHGGHATHMLEWFRKYNFCPTGCGCVCLEASGWT